MLRFAVSKHLAQLKETLGQPLPQLRSIEFCSGRPNDRQAEKPNGSSINWLKRTRFSGKDRLNCHRNKGFKALAA